MSSSANNYNEIEAKKDFHKQLIADIYSTKRHYKRDPALLKNLPDEKQQRLINMGTFKAISMIDIAEGGDVKHYINTDGKRFFQELYEYGKTEKDQDFFIGAETHGLLLQPREREAIKPIIDRGYNADIVTDMFTFQYENLQGAIQIYRRKYLKKC